MDIEIMVVERVESFEPKFEKEFLRNNPEQVPSKDDRLYHFSSDRIERLETTGMSKMFFAVEPDATLLIGGHTNFLHTFRVIKDFPLDLLIAYRGELPATGWGVKLNNEKTAVRWISITNALLAEYVELEAVEQVRTPQRTDKYSTEISRRVKQKRSDIFIPLLFNRNASLETLEADRVLIELALKDLAAGEIASEYTLEEIDEKMQEFFGVGIDAYREE